MLTLRNPEAVALITQIPQYAWMGPVMEGITEKVPTAQYSLWVKGPNYPTTELAVRHEWTLEGSFWISQLEQGHFGLRNPVINFAQGFTTQEELVEAVVAILTLSVKNYTRRILKASGIVAATLESVQQ